MITRGITKDFWIQWQSPLVVLHKPDEMLRLCLDFRKVNEVAKFDAFPMPHIEEMLEKIGQYITMTKGYWQILMAPEVQDKRAFGTHLKRCKGLLRWSRSPYVGSLCCSHQALANLFT